MNTPFPKVHRPMRHRPSCHLLLSLLVGVGILPGVARAQEAANPSTPAVQVMDWEYRLAEIGKGENTYRVFRERKRNPTDHRKLFEELASRFPDTLSTAKLQIGWIEDTAKAGDWPAYVKQSQDWLTHHPQWSEARFSMLHNMMRKLYDKQVPDAIKAELFQIIIPHLEGHGWLAGYAQNHLMRSELPPVEQYRTARRIADIAGPSPKMAAMLWQCISRLPADESAVASQACEQLIAQYPDTLEALQAKAMLLNRGDANDKAQAAQIQKQIADANKAWQAGLASLEGDLTVADATQAKVEQTVAAVESLLDQTPAFAQPALWGKLTALSSKMADAMQLALMNKLAGRIPTPSIAEQWVRPIQAQVVSSDAAVDTLLAVLDRSDEDRGRSPNIWQYNLLLIDRVANDPLKKAIAYEHAANAALRLGAHDRAAQWLFETARRNWVNDLPKAMKQLEQAAVTADWSDDGAKAGWMLSFLRGENNVIQSTSPRPYDPAQFIAETLPDCPLPEAGSATPAVVKGDAGWSLASTNAKANLLLNRPAAATSDAENALAAVDKDDKTFWRPTVFPAVLIASLAQQATPRQVTLTLETPTHFALTLLDAQGKPLARFERDWSFWDHHKSDDAWADGKVTLNLPPVNDVAYLRLELFNSRGQAGVTNLSLTPADVRAAGWLTGEPVKLDATSRWLALQYQADQPAQAVTLKTDTEASRGFPIFRWLSPWRRTKAAAHLNQFGDNISYVVDGTHVGVTLQGQGAIEWRIDDGASPSRKGRIEKPEKAGSADFTLATDLPPGRHLLRLRSVAIPSPDNQWWPSSANVQSVNVQSRARVTPAIRLSNDGRQWGPWLTGAVSTTDDTSRLNLAIPAGQRPAYAQAGLLLDARETMGGVSPVVRSFSLAASTDAGSPADVWNDNHLPALAEDLETVAGLLAERKVVIVYPKVGDPALHQFAQELAKRGRVYLVSDDIALNDYPGLALAIGTPLRHRHARQLLATHGLWLDPATLADEDGLVTLTRDEEGQPDRLYITGQTPQAVLRAGKRLADALDKRSTSPASKQAIEAFPASTLEMVYPWQLHTDRPALKELSLRMGQNDRRSTQWGLRANRTLKSLAVTCSALTGPGGATLPANQVKVRFASGYEWIPFFGDLRLPNGLSDAPVLPMQADSAIGLWLTVATTTQTAPGRYRGKVTLTADGLSLDIPVTLAVEPLALPVMTQAATYSFALVPYWFMPGSSLRDHAITALAANEAEHGVSHLGVLLNMTWSPVTSDKGLSFQCDFSRVLHEIKLCDEQYRRRGLPLPTYIGQEHRQGLHISQSVYKSKEAEQVDACTREMSRQLADTLRQAGLADRFILKVGDEPGDLVAWAKVARPYHEGGLRTMTCHNTNYPDMSVAIDLLNPWVPNYQHNLNLPFLRDRQRKGDPLWWYICGVPVTRLTGQPADNLPFYWLTAKWNLQGAMNYAAMHASDFIMPVPFRYEHGMDHRILFLADGSVLDTTRRELESDGIHDLKLIEHIRAQAGKLPAAQGRPILDRLDALIASIVPYKYEYPQAAQPWEKARQELYDLALQSIGRGSH